MYHTYEEAAVIAIRQAGGDAGFLDEPENRTVTQVRADPVLLTLALGLATTGVGAVLQVYLDRIIPRRLKESGKPPTVHLRVGLQRPDGERRWLEINGPADDVVQATAALAQRWEGTSGSGAPSPEKSIIEVGEDDAGRRST
jgi:hypothetical protein